uniref:Histone H2A n=1 Tax=Noctiluca scintillans TaxID=2966 RepID=A0A7S0ZT65_NOCSC
MNLDLARGLKFTVRAVSCEGRAIDLQSALAPLLPKCKHLSKGSKGSGKCSSRSSRAGLQFPVRRLHRCLKGHVPKDHRVGGLSGVFAASVMEYLAAEVLELAGNAAKEKGKTRIMPRHIRSAFRDDEELDSLLRSTVHADSSSLSPCS